MGLVLGFIPGDWREPVGGYNTGCEVYLLAQLGLQQKGEQTLLKMGNNISPSLRKFLYPARTRTPFPDGLRVNRF